MEDITAKFFTNAEGYTMEAIVKIIGSDLLIIVTGGNVPHLGTVTTFTKNTPL